MLTFCSFSYAIKNQSPLGVAGRPGQYLTFLLCEVQLGAQNPMGGGLPYKDAGAINPQLQGVKMVRTPPTKIIASFAADTLRDNYSWM